MEVLVKHSVQLFVCLVIAIFSLYDSCILGAVFDNHGQIHGSDAIVFRGCKDSMH